MPVCALAHQTDWTGWRRATRHFVLAEVEPAHLQWTIGSTVDPLPNASGTFTLSRALLALAAQAFQARENERFSLLYALIWRAHHGSLDVGDPDLRVALRWALAVRADAHRMRTHLRYSAITFQG